MGGEWGNPDMQALKLTAVLSHLDTAVLLRTEVSVVHMWILHHAKLNDSVFIFKVRTCLGSRIYYLQDLAEILFNSDRLINGVLWEAERKKNQVEQQLKIFLWISDHILLKLHEKKLCGI